MANQNDDTETDDADALNRGDKGWTDAHEAGYQHALNTLPRPAASQSPAGPTPGSTSFEARGAGATVKVDKAPRPASPAAAPTAPQFLRPPTAPTGPVGSTSAAPNTAAVSQLPRTAPVPPRVPPPSVPISPNSNRAPNGYPILPNTPERRYVPLGSGSLAGSTQNPNGSITTPSGGTASAVNTGPLGGSLSGSTRNPDGSIRTPSGGTASAVNTGSGINFLPRQQAGPTPAVGGQVAMTPRKERAVQPQNFQWQ
jgi:hypothetical protein